eukprot:7375901-Prymnesium_polylepis.3
MASAAALAGWLYDLMYARACDPTWPQASLGAWRVRRLMRARAGVCAWRSSARRVEREGAAAVVDPVARLGEPMVAKVPERPRRTLRIARPRRSRGERRQNCAGGRGLSLIHI